MKPLKQYAPVPSEMAHQIDALYHTLKAAETLLGVGRAYGLTVGLSPALKAHIGRRYGDGATFIIDNTTMIDPSKPRDTGESN